MNRITQYLPEICPNDGRNFDPESPLQLNQARHYDPPPGVWLNEEPVGYAGDDENVRKYVPSVAPDNSHR